MVDVLIFVDIYPVELIAKCHGKVGGRAVRVLQKLEHKAGHIRKFTNAQPQLFLGIALVVFVHDGVQRAADGSGCGKLRTDVLGRDGIVCLEPVDLFILLFAELNEFLAKLPKTERKIFILRYWFDEDISRIAQRTGYSVSRIKSLLKRLRDRLREELKKEGIIV